MEAVRAHPGARDRVLEANLEIAIAKLSDMVHGHILTAPDPDTLATLEAEQEMQSATIN